MQSQSFSGVNIHAHTCKQTHTSSCLLETGNGRHICTHYPSSRVHKQLYLGARLLLVLLKSRPLHTQTIDLVDDVKHTYSQPYRYTRLIAFTNTHSFFTFAGAFPLHARSIRRNLRNYLTSVGSLRSKRRSYCRLYCEAFGCGASVF